MSTKRHKKRMQVLITSKKVAKEGVQFKYVFSFNNRQFPEDLLCQLRSHSFKRVKKNDHSFKQIKLSDD